MRHPDSALTPTFVPRRPSGTGWVAYHDVAPVSGPSGLAMTWRIPEGHVRWAAIIDRPHEGWVAASGWHRYEHGDLSEVLQLALRGDRTVRLTREPDVLALLLPHAGRGLAGVPDADGLPPLPEHAALARRAVAQADLKPAMRAALMACLDHGAPRDVSLTGLRAKSRSAEWPALALAARYPELARVVLVAEQALLSGDDPMASIRRRWPGLSDAHLRRLREGAWPSGVALSAALGPAVAGCLDLLADCPVDWWPTDGEAWRAFEDCAHAIRAIRFACGGFPSPASLAASCGGDWPAFASRMQRAAGLGDTMRSRGAMVDHGRDCQDPVTSLAQGLLIPLLASRADEMGSMRIAYALGARELARIRADGDSPEITAALSAARDLLYGDRSAPAVLETSARWHARQAAIDAETRGAGGETAWPPLLKGEYRDSDVGVVAVSDYAALQEEGASGPDRDGVTGLKHCVATRLPDCVTGRAHILSVRLHAPDGTWRRLSTCQVAVDGTIRGRPRIRVTEHRGRGNGEPPPVAVAAVSRLSEDLRLGRVAAVPEALAHRQGGGGDAIMRRSGYDWREPEALARVLRAWEPLLPRWARVADETALLAAMAARGVVDQGFEGGLKLGRHRRMRRRAA